MKYLVCILLLISVLTARAQYVEVGIGAGLSGYSGELSSYRLENGYKFLLHPALQLEMRYNMSKKFSASAKLWFGSISGADSIADSSTRFRNLDFHSPITELSINAEYFPFRREFDQRLNLFITAGVAGFKFNPKTNIIGQEVELQPLNTEGQGLAQFPNRKPYSLTQWSIPIGGGIQLRVSESIQVQVSVTGSYTRTDYLDDVSTTYVDSDLLASANGSLSSQLSRRNLPNANGVVGGAAGSMRGSAGVNDFYYSGFISILFSLSNERGLGCYNW